MSPFNSAGAPQAVEGAFASYNPRFQIPAGPNGLVGGPNGAAIGRFGWADPFTGLVGSARLASTDQLGFVLPTRKDWRRTYWDRTRQAWISRTGFPLTLLRAGDVWARFPGGASPGQHVWANMLDGTAMARDGNFQGWTADSTTVTADSTFGTADSATTDGAPGSELTPWLIMSYAPPGELAIISTWSFFTP